MREQKSGRKGAIVPSERDCAYTGLCGTILRSKQSSTVRECMKTCVHVCMNACVCEREREGK